MVNLKSKNFKGTVKKKKFPERREISGLEVAEREKYKA